MDTRRLNTGDVLAMGILSQPLPVTEIPADRTRCDYDLYDGEPSRDDLLAALERGEVLVCAEYHGIPNVWKDGERYRGTLLQYRSVTEAPEFDAAEAALDWFVSTASAVAG